MLYTIHVCEYIYIYIYVYIYIYIYIYIYSTCDFHIAISRGIFANHLKSRILVRRLAVLRKGGHSRGDPVKAVARLAPGRKSLEDHLSTSGAKTPSTCREDPLGQKKD